jgi:hypothetical protein
VIESHEQVFPPFELTGVVVELLPVVDSTGYTSDSSAQVVNGAFAVAVVFENTTAGIMLLNPLVFQISIAKFIRSGY